MIGIIPYLNDLLVTKYRDEFEERLLKELKLKLKTLQENKTPEALLTILINYILLSDKSGIRHNSGVDENTIFEEAKYMLVSCSAFLNYLVQIYDSLQ